MARDLTPWIEPVLGLLALIGTFVFAASGALVAARLKQTFVTFAFFAFVTGVGGGTVRDLLIGVPVFWISDWLAAVTCFSAALLVWMTPARWWSIRALDWLDAVGLSAFAVFGAAKALNAGIAPFPAILMGIITGCVGGILRDQLAHRPSILLRPELYVTAAALSAALFVGLHVGGMTLFPAAALASGAGFALRAFAIVRGIGLPTYKGDAA